MPTQSQIEQFVRTYLPIAQKMEEVYGMPAYALLSQVALETNFGTSQMAKEKNNFGGVGAYDRDPSQALTFNSPEEAIDYQTRIQMAKPNFPDSPAGRQALQHYSSTAPILSDRNNPPEAVFAAMQDSPYSTDADYAQKLMVRFQQLQPYLNMQGPQQPQVQQPQQTAPTSRPAMAMNGNEMAAYRQGRPDNMPVKEYLQPPPPQPKPSGLWDMVSRFIAPRVPTGPQTVKAPSQVYQGMASPAPSGPPAQGAMKFTGPDKSVSYVNKQGQTVNPTPSAQPNPVVNWLADRFKGMFGGG